MEKNMEWGGKAVEVVRTGGATHAARHMAEWWRPIPRTPTPRTYITGPAALNIPHAGVWAGSHGLMWHLRIAGDGENIERANSTRMGWAKEWPYWDETSLRDAREGLATIGHPAAKREEPVYAATFARAVGEWIVRMAMAQGETLAYPQPRETRAWLKTDTHREQLADLLARAMKAQGHLKERIRTWQEQAGL